MSGNEEREHLGSNGEQTQENREEVKNMRACVLLIELWVGQLIEDHEAAQQKET